MTASFPARAAALAVAFGAAFAPPAQAQAWPEKNITIVVRAGGQYFARAR